MECVKVDRKALMRLTGLSKEPIAKGIRSLKDAGFVSVVRPRDKYMQYSGSYYYLLDPTDREPLTIGDTDSLLHANGLHYFKIPKCCVQKPSKNVEPWLLSAMSLPTRRLYIVLAWLATQRGTHEYDVTAQQLKKIASLSHLALRKSLDELETRRLV